VHLPSDVVWDLESKSAVLESEEVTPEEEDEPDAGIPRIAELNNLIEALPVTVIQELVQNVRSQKPAAGVDALLKAPLYYYDNDAFIGFLSVHQWFRRTRWGIQFDRFGGDILSLNRRCRPSRAIPSW